VKLNISNINHPKVVIIGQPFNNVNGGGITLSNLFRGWPKEKIAVTATGHMMYNVSTDVCDTYYQLGKEEHKWTFPFNLIQRTFPSGLLSFNTNKQSTNYSQTGIRYIIVNQLFYPFLRWTGLFHCLSKISLSQKFKAWLEVFQPEILYIQVSSRENIIFAKQLVEYLKIPNVIHIMDDWPSTISKKGLFKHYWYKKIDSEFKQLLDAGNLHLSISEDMSNEYNNRYNKEFIAFHNPLDTEIWTPFSKKEFSLNTNHITILYSGRIGIGIEESLIEVASAVDLLNDKTINIKIHIQTSSDEPKILNKLQKFDCVIINPFVDYSELPKIFSCADILLLANDFNDQGSTYLKFSMPTKASEYMISGTPILVYAPGETAVSKFFSKNECGLCVTIQNSKELVKAIHFLIINEEYRRKISENAISIAKELFDADKVRTKFQLLLINITTTQNNVYS
jgi:glycosyltransferase involved in cell wall biosynthesis